MALVCSSISTFSINLPQGARENCIFFSCFVFVGDISVSCSSRVKVQDTRLGAGSGLPEGPAGVRRGSADVLMSTKTAGPARAVTSVLPVIILYSGAAKAWEGRKHGCSSQCCQHSQTQSLQVQGKEMVTALDDCDLCLFCPWLVPHSSKKVDWHSCAAFAI